MVHESEEEAELVRKNKLLLEAMTATLNQTIQTIVAEMMKISVREIRDELRQEIRKATGQGHSNESRRDRRTQTQQEHAGSEETDNYYERHNSSSSRDSRRRQRRDHDGRRHHRDEFAGIKLKIPLFHGKADPDAYLEWEKKIEIVFNCQHYTNAQRIQLA